MARLSCGIRRRGRADGRVRLLDYYEASESFRESVRIDLPFGVLECSGGGSVELYPDLRLKSCSGSLKSPHGTIAAVIQFSAEGEPLLQIGSSWNAVGEFTIRGQVVKVRQIEGRTLSELFHPNGMPRSLVIDGGVRLEGANGRGVLLAESGNGLKDWFLAGGAGENRKYRIRLDQDGRVTSSERVR